METQGTAVFDVCGTITKTNNTFDFIRFVLRRDSAFKYCLFLLVRVLCSLCGLPGIRRIVAGNWLRCCQIALLRGYSATRLREMSELYADALFAGGLLNRRIVELLEHERGRGNAVVLVSAAIGPPIAAIAARLDVEGFFSSELEIAHGCCTGRLSCDLLGRKHTVLEKISTNTDLRNSSVYSDNPEDAQFMKSFGKRYAVLNASGTERMWGGDNGGFQFIVNYDAPGTDPDVDSINRRTAKWAYIPPLYYVISRFHWTGLYSLFFREIIPITLAGYLFTTVGALSFILMPLSFLIFYSIYEIGGIANDLYAKRESSGVSTRRIAPDVHIHRGVFIAIRAAVAALLLYWLPVAAYPMLVYIGLLCLCLAVYLLHNLLPRRLRPLTFAALKLCRNCIPLAVLVSRVPLMTLLWLCAIFFVMDTPWRVYAYCRRQKLTLRRTPVWYVRRVHVMLLCGLGALIYLTVGSLDLLVISSYYVVLECLWIIRATVSQRVSIGRSYVGIGQTGKAGSSSAPCA